MTSERFSRNSTVETSPVGDRVVLYEGRSRKAIVLNPTGAWLWEELSTPQTSDELSQKLQQRFPAVDVSQVRSDVEACLNDLMQQEVVLKEA